MDFHVLPAPCSGHKQQLRSNCRGRSLEAAGEARVWRAVAHRWFERHAPYLSPSHCTPDSGYTARHAPLDSPATNPAIDRQLLLSFFSHCSLNSRYPLCVFLAALFIANCNNICDCIYDVLAARVSNGTLLNKEVPGRSLIVPFFVSGKLLLLSSPRSALFELLGFFPDTSTSPLDLLAAFDLDKQSRCVRHNIQGH